MVTTSSQHQITVFGRGYLGSLLASTIYGSHQGSLDSRSPDSPMVLNESFEQPTALIASGPSSVSASSEELATWRARILRWCEAHRTTFKHVVYFSSAGTVYGEMRDAPHTEEAPLRPVNDYGSYHIWVESILEESFPEGLTILRLANIYGPHQRMKNGQGFVTAAVRAIEESRELTIFGDGSIIRDYIHESDVLSLVQNVLKRPTPGIFNVATGFGTTQRAVVAMVEEAFEGSLAISFVPSRATDLKVSALSIAKAQQEYSWSPRINLLTGIDTYKASR